MITSLPSFIGQDHVQSEILPFLNIHEARLSPPNRPAGVFMLAGPTGTGKTHLIRSIAKALHGNSNHFLNINCGEFQSDHEVAKIIGAPPGYLGHRETQPMLGPQRIKQYTSERCYTSLLLFDEFEKSAGALERLLYNVLDRGELQLADGTKASMEHCMIFFTTNIGDKHLAQNPDDHYTVREMIHKRFSVPFMNRIDRVLVYKPLDRETASRVLELELREAGRHIREQYPRLILQFSPDLPEHLLNLGFSEIMGARELKRAIWQKIYIPLSNEILKANLQGGRDNFTATINPHGVEISNVSIFVPPPKPVALGYNRYGRKTQLTAEDML